MTSRCESFRDRLRARDVIIGTFLKTPSPIVTEVLTHSDLNVVCIDTEHAPFGRLELDLCVASLRAADFPSIVRLANDSSTEIRNALDSGATAILVPHVTSASQAASIVKSAHFGEGGRGFAGSTRASEFTGKKMPNHLADSARQTTVILQIEDLAAVENVAQIISVEGVDAIFIGRVDLAVAMEKSPMDADVIATVKDICRAAENADVAVGMFTSSTAELPMWQDLGCNFYLLSSDQSLMLEGANQLARIID